MLTKIIKSPQHRLIKYLVKIRENKQFRCNEKKVLLTGINTISEISKKMKAEILFLPETAQLDETSFNFEKKIIVSELILKKITALKEPGPAAALFSFPKFSNPEKFSLFLILDAISDPGNLGTLIRSAYSLGFEAIILSENSVDIFNEKCLRAAKGGQMLLPYYHMAKKEIINFVKLNSLNLYIADMQGENYKTPQYKKPLGLVLGSESCGISEELLNLGKTISIPMIQEANSLNVAAAGAILMVHIKENS